MGLFSGMLGKNITSTNLNEQESILGLILSVIAIDGHVSNEEFEDLVSITKKSNILKGMSGDQFRATLDKLVKILTRESIDTLVDLCVDGLPIEYRESAFALCCDLMFSDGYIENEEEELLGTLKYKLDIEDSMAMRIVEVISIKNKI